MRTCYYYCYGILLQIYFRLIIQIIIILQSYNTSLLIPKTMVIFTWYRDPEPDTVRVPYPVQGQGHDVGAPEYVFRVAAACHWRYLAPAHKQQQKKNIVKFAIKIVKYQHTKAMFSTKRGTCFQPSLTYFYIHTHTLYV